MRVTAGAVVVGLIGIAHGFGLDTRAQEPAEVDWLRVDFIDVIPTRLDDFIELQLEEVIPGMQRAGVPWRSGYRTAEFGSTYQLAFASPLTSLSDYDAGGPLARSLRPDRYRNLLERIRSFTASRRSYAMRYHPQLSVESDVQGAYLNEISFVQVTPGRTQDWMAFLQRNRDGLKVADVSYGVYERLFGPGPLVWLIVQEHVSFAELSRPGILARAFGDRAGDVAADLAGVVAAVERVIFRYDPELSYTTPDPR